VTLQEQITTALSEIIGLPLWGSNRALNVGMFEFGERRKQVNRKGKEYEVGQYALHVQCPWRIVGPSGIVVACEDRNYPDDEMSDWGHCAPDTPSRCEVRIAAWLQEHSSAPLKAERAEADRVGGFRLLLQSDYVLEVFPASSLRGEYSEHWRLFQPSNDASHFVVTGHGVQDSNG
jgi:hypothetical protein